VHSCCYFDTRNIPTHVFTVINSVSFSWRCVLLRDCWSGEGLSLYTNSFGLRATNEVNGAQSDTVRTFWRIWSQICFVDDRSKRV
jgi:hypothetical protein